MPLEVGGVEVGWEEGSASAGEKGYAFEFFDGLGLLSGNYEPRKREAETVQLREKMMNQLSFDDDGEE